MAPRARTLDTAKHGLVPFQGSALIRGWAVCGARRSNLGRCQSLASLTQNRALRWHFGPGLARPAWLPQHRLWDLQGSLSASALGD